MNARTIRRAIERKAEKQARKELKAALANEREVLTAEFESTKATLEQLQANRRNAQLSTGPKTPEGKATSSRNALKTGLTGKAVLLPSDDAALYEQKPLGDREIELTQSIADSKWRLARIPGLEFGIYALGRLQFAEEFSNHSQSEATALIEAKTFLTYQRQLNNLSIQESRLRRQCEKDTAELKRLQELRAGAERTAAIAVPTPKTIASKAIPEEFGFEFSTADRDPFEAAADLTSSLRTRPQAA